MSDHAVKRRPPVRVVDGTVRQVVAKPSVQPPAARRSYDVKEEDADNEGPVMIALSAGQFTALLVMMGVLMFLVLAAAVLAPVLAKYAFPVDSVTIDTSNHSRTVTPAAGAVFVNDALAAATDTVTAYGQMSNGTRSALPLGTDGRLLTDHVEAVNVTVAVETNYVPANDTGLAQAASLPERHQTAAQLWAASVEVTAGSTTTAVPTYGAASCAVMGGGGTAETQMTIDWSPDSGSTWYSVGGRLMLSEANVADDWVKYVYVYNPHLRVTLVNTTTFSKAVWVSCTVV